MRPPALARLQSLHIVLMLGLAWLVIGDAERAASLWARSAVGEIPDWLEPVPEARNGPFVAYRVKL